MPFSLENKPQSIIKFVINDPFNIDDLKKILSIISHVLSTKKPFSFYVDCINLTSLPSAEMSKYLILWMRESKEKLLQTLQGSAIIISNQTFANILNGVFKLQPLVKPNLICTDINKGEKFVTDIMTNYFKKTKIVL